MPLAILIIRKELHGFLFLCIRVVPFSIIMGLRLAFGPPELRYKQNTALGLKRQTTYQSWFVALRYAPRDSLCVLTKKKVSEVEHTPIPEVPGSNIAIGQSLSMVVLQRSCGTRRRPQKPNEITFKIKNNILPCVNLGQVSLSCEL